MYNEILNNLTKIEEIDLIYLNTKINENGRSFTYTIVVDSDDVLSKLEICKKIIATMEIIKELFPASININYDIISSNFIEERISNKEKRFVNNFAKSEILYSKDDYYQELAESINTKRSRA